ncbi:hypothetical protein BABINDRAFT_161902 [Babjeviella inositovora NRRL Y-12698]|uniref:Uncharacterized protein n=1 Tax=Babjeviella inositovora NRRL Y-12698 TaxID=984486 RepID=A0A1E3QP73_9ASCO|nr:uncharacterized protein BABINDRAFT_161902 [Babjeviella inositovora NRRL Y-12698]ODQ79509.1 hypothetical protein BABINDRAFT_161902 [Babjeviella inositovora NRRL Y-12698]
MHLYAIWATSQCGTGIAKRRVLQASNSIKAVETLLGFLGVRLCVMDIVKLQREIPERSYLRTNQRSNYR